MEPQPSPSRGWVEGVCAKMETGKVCRVILNWSPGGRDIKGGNRPTGDAALNLLTNRMKLVKRRSKLWQNVSGELCLHLGSCVNTRSS